MDTKTDLMKGKEEMRKALIALMILLASAGLALAVPQDKAKAPDNAKMEEKSPIPLRVQLVFTEFDGDKKVVSLPYSFSVNADERRARPNTQIRDGARIPIYTNKEQLQYVDVGTNIDCSAQSQDDGRYKLILSVERSSVSQETSVTNAPIIRTFRAEMNPILKDGQTFESVMATDPVNGHVYRVTVTLNVPK
jgi:hypothetical protein